MRKIKTILIILLIIFINFTAIPVYANTEIEENEITKEELDEIIETASNLEKVPNINARNAVIYDRTSRKNYIWKKRGSTMQNG